MLKGAWPERGPETVLHGLDSILELSWRENTQLLRRCVKLRKTGATGATRVLGAHLNVRGPGVG